MVYAYRITGTGLLAVICVGISTCQKMHSTFLETGILFYSTGATLLHEWSGAFSIDSPTPTLRMNLNLNEPTILFACVILLFWILLTSYCDS
jgi:hypothetical protein